MLTYRVLPHIDQVFRRVTVGADVQGAQLPVHGVLEQVHLAAGVDGESLGEADPAVGVDAGEPVRHGDLVHLGLFPVGEERVRLPDHVQDLPVQRKF